MPSTISGADRNDIAIVGMGCRFPGARNVNEYWNLLRSARPQFRGIPDSRWRHDSFLSADIRDHHSAYTDKMALVDEVDSFDAKHYGMPPRRARALDPQHRLLIDLSREAIQDAGWETTGFDRDNTAAIMAVSESGYREISMMHLRMRQLAGGEFGTPVHAPDATSAVGALQGTSVAGVLMNMGPNSVSSAFGLHGESYALDAACSGGLAAVANAVFALRAGRCRIALAGSAQLIFAPDLLVGLCRIGAISRSGVCRPFDTRADGIVLGEGAGVLVLRPLADARANGDRVYATIRGIGMSNDGKVVGNMSPQREGQLRALHAAYADAALDPGAAGYLEAHGTATAAGDQAELSALRELRTGVTEPAYLGATKAILGHSLGTAGMAGLIKSTLSVHRGEIAPQPEFEPDPDLRVAEAGLRIPTAPTSWTNPAGPRVAGVSAFGFGGTNVHMVIEQADEPPRTATERPTALLLSARDRSGLAAHARELARTLRREAPPLASVARTLATRTRLSEVLTVPVESISGAAESLATAANALDSGVDPASYPETAVELDDTAPLCTLPPNPLSPKRYWIVGDTPAVEPNPALSIETDAPVSIESAGSARSVDPRTVLFEEVARISAFPIAEVDGDQHLVAQLGFDSLMLQELESKVRKRIPRLTIDIRPEQNLTINSLVPSGTVIAPEPLPNQWDASAAHIEQFPEVAAIETRLSEISHYGPSPYFRTHEGISRDRTIIGDRSYISFSSYNYLGLSGHPAVSEAVRSAVDRYGSSVSGSRLLGGDRPVAKELDAALAELVGAEDCITMVSGHATNVSVVGHLVGDADLIVHDSLAHDSILQGCTLSGATRQPFPHNDMKQLDYILARTRARFRRVLIVVEGVYSMDGDLAPLPELIELKKRYGALLLVDEAHSIATMGAHGGGVGEHFGVDRTEVDLWMGTLSKSLASCGGYLAGSKRTVNWLRYTLPGFVYSAGISPPNAAAALAAIKVIRAEPWRLERLRDNARLFGKLARAAGLGKIIETPSPIVPVMIGDSGTTLRAAQRLFDRGIVADAILYPAVAEQQTRLRFFITSEHTEDELHTAITTLAAAISAETN